ncbi:MAG TPA: CGNR zinc finger domain-containing protein [Galbitalea sp.]|jgi:predicted RNA-binding Zn ribbon-like protein
MTVGGSIPAPGEEIHVSLALVNTRVAGAGGPLDRLSTREELAEWYTQQALPPARLAGQELAAVHALRDDARSVFAAIEHHAPLPVPAVARINQTASEPAHPALGSDRSLRWLPIASPSAPAALARDLINLSTSSEATLLRTCAADDCDRMFLLPHGRQIWCSAQCGNRIRARRHSTANTRMS